MIVVNLLDILIVSTIFYYIMRLVNNTRAGQMLRAIFFFFITTVVASFLNFDITEWLFKSLWTVSLIVVVVIFQPEIRSILADIGKKRFFGIKFQAEIKDEILKAVKHFSALKIGALIVIERNTLLKEYIENGIPLQANITSELLKTIFMPRSALHDGAVIIQRNLIVSASSFLPLSKIELDTNIGTRHRAAIGLSEVSDALIIVVSEETGDISIFQEEDMEWHISLEELGKICQKVFGDDDSYIKRWFKVISKLSNWKKNFNDKMIAFTLSLFLWYYIKFMILGR